MSNELLHALRVLDLGGAEADAVSRLFADLGADVLKIEPPAGSPARHAPPSVAGASIPFALHNANKRSAVLDPDSAGDRDRLIELAGAQLAMPSCHTRSVGCSWPLVAICFSCAAVAGVCACWPLTV